VFKHMIKAVIRNDTDAITSLLGDDVKGVGPDDELSEGGETALCVAANFGYTYTMTLLIKRRADVNFVTNIFGMGSPLTNAISSGHYRASKMLIDARADLEVKDIYGSTSLHLAVDRQHNNCIDLLLKSKANINAVDNKGFTPLRYSLQNMHIDIFNRLIKGGADVNVQGKDGSTTLMDASTIIPTEPIKAPIKAKASLDLLDNNCMTALHHCLYDIACLKDNKDSVYGLCSILTLIIDAGADLNIHDYRGYTSMSRVAPYSEDVVELLVKAGADIGIKSYPFHRHGMNVQDGITAIDRCKTKFLKRVLPREHIKKLTTVLSETTVRIRGGTSYQLLPLPIDGGYIELYRIIAVYATPTPEEN